MQRVGNDQVILHHSDIRGLCKELSLRIIYELTEKTGLPIQYPIYIYGVPRGGVAVAYMLENTQPDVFQVCDDPNRADIFVDDIVDSGTTQARWMRAHPSKMFAALIDKGHTKFQGRWVVFPWERLASGNESVEDNIVRLLQFVGEDPKRGGLLETPKRVAKAWTEWCSGYKKNPADILKGFEDGSENYDQLIVVKNIPFYSHCEHHMAPFFGTCSFGYLPGKRIVGLSKIPELIDVFSQRLQVQERLANQIVQAFHEHFQPKGVGIVMEARHMCMESRGKKKVGQSTITSALRGIMLTDGAFKAEFLSLIR